MCCGWRFFYYLSLIAGLKPWSLCVSLFSEKSVQEPEIQIKAMTLVNRVSVHAHCIPVLSLLNTYLLLHVHVLFLTNSSCFDDVHVL